MPEWVLDSVDYEATIIGGNLQNHKVSVCVHRERKGKYSVDVDIRPPGGSRFLVAGNSMQDAGIHRQFSNPKQALDAGFRALWRKLNQNGKNTLDGPEQSHIHWVYLKEDGSVDWAHMEGLSEKERASKTNKELPYTPPTSEAIMSNDRAKQTGRAFKVDAKLSGLDESGTDVKVGKRDGNHDGQMGADVGLHNFLQSRGMGPKLDGGSKTEAPEEEISVPGQNGPESGATLARDEPAVPVDVPSTPFPS